MEAGRETVLMQATLKVYRHDPDAGGKPTFQPYPLELPEDATVLDGLVKIREELDGTLAFRASCNRGFCGECTLRINRGGRLACMTRVASARTKEGEVTVEPIRNVRVLKDLVYDVDQLLWQKIKAVEPWLQPTVSQPEREHVLSDEQLRPVRNAMRRSAWGSSRAPGIPKSPGTTTASPPRSRRADGSMRDGWRWRPGGCGGSSTSYRSPGGRSGGGSCRLPTVIPSGRAPSGSAGSSRRSRGDHHELRLLPRLRIAGRLPRALSIRRQGGGAAGPRARGADRRGVQRCWRAQPRGLGPHQRADVRQGRAARTVDGDDDLQHVHRGDGPGQHQVAGGPRVSRADQSGVPGRRRPRVSRDGHGEASALDPS